MTTIQAGWEALAALQRFRWLTSWQVAKLFFLGRRNLSGEVRGNEAARKAANERCLRRLKDRQLIEARQAVLRSGPNWIRREYNVLTIQGHQLLRDHQVAHGEQPTEWDARRVEIAPESLAHALLVNDVAIALLRSCEHHEWSLLAWIDDFAALAGRSQVSFERFIPDAAALIEQRDRRALYLIEADRGTEPVASEASNSWRSKVRRYQTYLTDAYASDAFFAAQPDPIILTVTSSPERLVNLMTETRRTGASDRWWFTCIDWIEPPYDALGPIWRRPTGGDAFYSLLDEMAARPA